MDVQEQVSVIFEPHPLDQNHCFNLPENTTEIFISVDVDVQVNGLLFEKSGNKDLMIYFQGNAKNLQNFIDNHRMVLDWGFNVVVTDYRSFGKSNGKLTGEHAFYLDAEKIYEYALSLGYQAENIILYGYSMGTSAATYLAATKKAKAVILESAYSSIPEIQWVGNRTPAFELNSAEKAVAVVIPTLLIHGDLDEVITLDHSQRIFNRLKLTMNKEIIVIQGGGHDDLKQRPEYANYIREFINKIS